MHCGDCGLLTPSTGCDINTLASSIMPTSACASDMPCKPRSQWLFLQLTHRRRQAAPYVAISPRW